MVKHKGRFETCCYCQRHVRSGESFFDDSKDYTETIRKLHRIAIARRERESVMRDMGLEKGRDSLGRVIWE